MDPDPNILNQIIYCDDKAKKDEIRWLNWLNTAEQQHTHLFSFDIEDE